MTAEIRKQAPRAVDKPRPGYFLMKLVKGGPLCPVAIIYEFGVWRSEINGVIRGEPNADPMQAGDVMRVWLHWREEIDLAEYRRLLKLTADPAHPSSQPTKAINLAELPPLF
jgi:hypothetical protein